MSHPAAETDPEKLPLSGAVLAGGQARRFGGRDKTGIRFGRESLCERTVNLLYGFCREVIISSNRLHRHSRARIVPDRIPGQGPLGAIASCLAAATSPWLLVLAGDLPFITAPALQRLWPERLGYDVVIPRSPDGLQPLAALYHRRCLEPISALLKSGNFKIKDFFPAVRVREFPCRDHPDLYPPHIFLNINSPADLEKARKLAATPTALHNQQRHGKQAP